MTELRTTIEDLDRWDPKPGQPSGMIEHAYGTYVLRSEVMAVLDSEVGRRALQHARWRAVVDLEGEMAALAAGTHEPAVDDFGNQYLSPLPQPPLLVVHKNEVIRAFAAVMEDDALFTEVLALRPDLRKRLNDWIRSSLAKERSR